MEERVSTLKEDLKIIKKTIIGAPSGGEMVVGQSKVKVPELKPFKGSRNAKKLKNFLWDMDQYFKAVQMAEEEQVTITTMYLSGMPNFSGAQGWKMMPVQADERLNLGKS